MGNIMNTGYFVGNLKTLISDEQYSDILEYSKQLKGLPEETKAHWNYRFDGGFDEFDENGHGRTAGLSRNFNDPDSDIASADVNFVKKVYEFKKQINESPTHRTEQSFWEIRQRSCDDIPFLKSFNKLSVDIVKKLYPDNNYELNSLTTPEGWFTLFEEKDKICPHRDGFNEGRVCALLIYLNEEWEDGDGGELILIDNDENSIKIEPTFGTVVVLDFLNIKNNLSHEVLPIKGDFKRWAYICFPTTNK